MILRKTTASAARALCAAAVLLLGAVARGQTVVPDAVVADTAGIRRPGGASDVIVPDTALILRQYEESNRFYDRLQARAADSRLARRLYRALVSEDDRTAPPLEPILQREVDYFRRFAGRPIRSVHVLRGNVFGERHPKGDLRGVANSLHGVTREDRIRRDLLFKAGEPLDPALMARNEQMLRALDYLADADLVIVPTGEGDGGVDVYVLTHDSWSIGGTIHSVPRDGRRYIDLYDTNILGSGNRLGLRAYVGFGNGNKFYGGNMLEYRSTNLWGSFFDLSALGGWGYDERRLRVTIDKPLIRQTDFLVGGAAEYSKFYEWQTTVDTALLVGRRRYELYGGKSWDFPAANSSFYIAARYRDIDWFERPEVRADLNTHYHSRRVLLLSAGIYRETYYRGNMIFGFGTTENIPYGHKFELTGGRYRGEFGDRWYGAFTAAAGRQVGAGYLRVGGTVGSFMTDGGRLERSTLGLQLDAFSGLWRIGRNHLRQFLWIHYLAGFHRLSGEGEELTFSAGESPEGFRFQPDRGKVRLNATAESVLFTPIYLYGFRFAFFAFGAVGWLGDHPMPLRNDPYASVGLGVRLKNERLIFNTFQIRLGLGFSTRGWVDYRYVRFSAESRLIVPTFKAVAPEIYPFR